MNIIDTSQIVDPNIEQPFTGPSLAFLQAANSDMIQALGQAFIGNSYSPSTMYALVGIQYTGSISTPSAISAGYILFNNEVFLCPGGSSFTIGAQFKVVVTNPAPDPLTFSDNNARNVHNVRTITILNASSGGVPLANVIYLYPTFIPPSWVNETLLNSWTNSTAAKHRVRQDVVEITGIITNATLTNASLPMFNLPSGARPPVDTYISVNVVNNGTFYSRDVLVSASTGAMTLDTTGFSNVTTTVYLNGTRFYTT